MWIDMMNIGPINNYCWTTLILLPFKSPRAGLMRHPKPVGGIEVFKSDKW